MQEALANARSGLRSTSMTVTHRDGSTIETRDGTVTSTLPPPDVLPPALQPERKRLCIEPPTAPTWALPPLEGFQLPPMSVSDLCIVTWNVWFAPQDADARMAALFSEALSLNPDVLCLQEVVPELAESIRRNAALRREYAMSENNVGPYGCVLLARWSLRPTFREVPFACSRMGRSLLVAEWSPPELGRKVAVATSHLESLNHSKLRAKQLAVARHALEGYEAAILCGDFNFDATQNWGDWREVPPRPPRPTHPLDEDSDSEAYAGPVPPPADDTRLENGVLARELGSSYVDAWPALRPTEAGHTFDGATNPYVAEEEECMRYDRVMVRGMRPLSIAMIGDGAVRALRQAEAESSGAGAGAEPADGAGGAAERRECPPAPPAVVPSDHFGLCATVELRPAGS